MGRLIYRDAAQSFDIEDRLLAHLRVVTMNKLRRREPFMLEVPSQVGVGTHSIWIAPAVPIVFHFYGGRAPALDSDLVEQMMKQASGPDGLDLVQLSRG
jgi:hypothetical protein